MKGWMLLTLGIAFFGAVRSALRKYLTDDYGTLELSFTTNVYETIFLLPAALWEAVHVMEIEAVSPTVVGVATLSGLFGALTSVAGYRAFALEDLSVAKPLIKLNPIIVALVEPTLLAEAFDHTIFTGTVLAGMGGYVILLRDHGVLDPIRRFTEPGLQFALLAAVAAAGSVLTTRYAAQRLPNTRSPRIGRV